MSVRRELKQSVLVEADYCCYYCSGPADTVDHKEALAAGGSDRRENLVACCGPCNLAKGTLPYDTFVRFVARFGRPKNPGQWWVRTNKYQDRALLNIVNRVDPERMAEIVLEKFASGDTERASVLMRRCFYRCGATVSDEELAALLPRSHSTAIQARTMSF